MDVDEEDNLTSLLPISRILKESHTGSLETFTESTRALPQDSLLRVWTKLRYPRTGDSILHTLARLGHSEAIVYLLSRLPLDIVNCQNNDSKTPLHEACQFGQFRVADLLLSHGADVNALKRADWTPLMLACACGTVGDDLVELLIERGAILSCRNKDGWSALHLVCRGGAVSVFDLLVGSKHQTHQDRSQLLDQRTNNGRTCLHIASLHGHLDIVSRLIHVVGVDQTDNCGNTALHEAAAGGHTDVCRFLIEKGAVAAATNHVGFNLLHVAASEGHLSLVDYLVDELLFDVDAVTRLGFTALHCAAKKGRGEMCGRLIGCKGADCEVRDQFERLARDYCDFRLV